MNVSRRLLRSSLRTALRTTAYARLGGRAHGSVLVLGHMRAGTSLLAHLLCSHAEVEGWGERNHPLADSADLRRMAMDIAWRAHDPRLVLPPPVGPRWLLDVVNHDALLPRPSILERQDLRLIFILREPEGCLASMSAYLGRHYGWTARRAATAYVTRLATLRRLAQGLGPRASARSDVIHFKELIEDPASALAPAARLLHLSAQPGARYARQPWTGRFGDRSPTIHTGRVVKEEERLGVAGRPRADLDPATIQAARDAYIRCRATLTRLSGSGQQ